VKGVDYPHVTGANVTRRRAQRVATAAPESIAMFEPEADR